MQNAEIIWSINPFKLAENSASTQRRLSVGNLTRFAEFLATEKGEIEVTFTGFRDDDRRKLMRCKLEGHVEMECQSTFQPIEVAIEREIIFYPVMSEESIASAPDEYEAFLFDTDELDLVNLVEDELILSLPIVVNSPESPQHVRFGPEIEEQKADKPNPFAVLEQLKQSSKE